jgi:hypothetical protein
MDTKYNFYNEFDTIVADVLGFFLSKKSAFIIKNFNIKNPSHRFYYELLKMCYSLTGNEIYYQTNIFDYIVKKIFIFKNDCIKFANKNSKGCELDFNSLSETLELSEKKLGSIYYAYYYNK